MSEFAYCAINRVRPLLALPVAVTFLRERLSLSALSVVYAEEVSQSRRHSLRRSDTVCMSCSIMSNGAKQAEEVSTMDRSPKDHYRDIAEATQTLRDGHHNLQRIADYCEKNYTEAADKQKALQDTMSLVTQTLASVACQVEVAARHVAYVLEEQSQTLVRHEMQIRLISQLVDIHTERVSRHKIGTLTTRKRTKHPPKIQSEEKPGRPTSYTRVPINFTSLDHVGRGVTDSDSQFSRTGTMSRKVSVKSQTQGGVLGRNSRLKDPILPPVLPEGKFPLQSTAQFPDTPSPVSPRPNGTICDFIPPPPPPPSSVHQDSEPPTAEMNHLAIMNEYQYDAELSDYPSTTEPSNLPPPVDYEMNDLPWFPNSIEEENGISLQEFGDSLPPPPPPPDYEMREDIWPQERVTDFHYCFSSLDHLLPLPPPPPPDA
ncbi:ABI gene family member 3 [Spea bombifrons]|uniref:ABI gene family member 3 n=1 Tax=Spea bombifrons TaxID=233779 RepID=UPI00234B9358|nr:ABI gene family member 3 [Spea bombifrons]